LKKNLLQKWSIQRNNWVQLIIKLP
jgi:hypothetical protein